MGTKFYINFAINETVAVPNTTDYSHMKMLQRGFNDVSEDEYDNYIRTHFND